MEPNPLAALAPPPEELKKRCSRSRYGLGSEVSSLLRPTAIRVPTIPASPQTLHVRHVRTRSRPASSIYPVSRDVRRTGEIWSLRANPSQHAGYKRALIDPQRNALATTHRSRAGDRRGPVELAS